MLRKFRLILCVLSLIVAGLVALVLYQWSVLIGKKLALRSSQTALFECEQQVSTAKEVLAEVSSDDYKELGARRRGYGVLGERGFWGV